MICVVGAGRMGTALAYSFGRGGDPVALVDTSQAARDRAPQEISRIAGLCRTDVPTVTVHDRLEAAVEGADLVIESATENADVKRRILAAVSAATGADTLVSTNTSSIPLRDLVGAMQDPRRFLGTHFWNPPYAIRLVELVGSLDTAPSSLVRATALLRSAGFHPVQVHVDLPGLIGNRLQHALKREAIALVAAGVADAETVDSVAKLALGARLAVLGPLEQSDLVGLDLTRAIHETLIPDLDRSDHVQGYLLDLVSGGNLGMKTGRGFRSWTTAQAAATRDRLDRHLLGHDDPPSASPPPTPSPTETPPGSAPEGTAT